MDLIKWEFATYCSESSLIYLPCCVEGFKQFMGLDLSVYCLDQQAIEFAESKSYSYKTLRPHRYPHVSSLEILRTSEADLLVLVDSDCWVLNDRLLHRAYQVMSNQNVAMAGDLGWFDFPYLFKGVLDNGCTLFEKLRLLMRDYPRFFKAWAVADTVKNVRFNTGCVVNMPFVYGGFAVYRTSFFRTLEIPDWIYSADLYLGMFAFENNLFIESMGEYQFNRRIINTMPSVHFAGPKPSALDVKKYCHEYREYLTAQREKQQ
jgi:hypothetical protein